MFNRKIYEGDTDNNTFTLQTNKLYLRLSFIILFPLKPTNSKK